MTAGSTHRRAPRPARLAAVCPAPGSERTPRRPPFASCSSRAWCAPWLFGSTWRGGAAGRRRGGSRVASLATRSEGRRALSQCTVTSRMRPGRNAWRRRLFILYITFYTTHTVILITALLHHVRLSVCCLCCVLRRVTNLQVGLIAHRANRKKRLDCTAHSPGSHVWSDSAAFRAVRSEANKLPQVGACGRMCSASGFISMACGPGCARDGLLAPAACGAHGAVDAPSRARRAAA